MRMTPSPMKPLSSGRPMLLMVMIMKMVAKIGMLFESPPKSAIMRVCRRS